MKSFTSVYFLLMLFGLASAARTSFQILDPDSIATIENYTLNEVISRKADSVLSLMTLDEKIGQLNQYSWNFIDNDSIAANYSGDLFRKAQVGSVFNVNGLERLIWLQTVNLKNSRLKIPLIFAGDVGHGFVTEFPIPLAESCSWDLDIMQQTTRIAAKEASASGICWTFAPMIDLSRDPRWGRVQEGAGEDPYLASLVAAARVQGYQNFNSTHFLLGKDALFATAKHFVAYGAAQAGRDYHTVDLSDRSLFEFYLPPFQAAVKAGVASVMTAFNDLNGFPCTGNKYLLTHVLREKLKFKGLVVSDYTAINELVPHGFAKDDKQAAELAINAGVDVDMIGESFVRYIPELIQAGKVSEFQINRAVSKILELKFRAGLFDNPFRYLDPNNRDSSILHPKHVQAALLSAQNAIVMLKNNGILPLSKSPKVAIVGPHALSPQFISPLYNSKLTTSNYAERIAFLNLRTDLSVWLKASGFNIQGVAKGCSLFPDNDDSQFAEALNLAAEADVILAVMGEDKSWCGEGNSRADIVLPGLQREFLKELKKTGKSVILILFNGRPLDLSWEDENVDAIIEAWYPGMMGGEAICQLVEGTVNPSAKLTMTFPRNVGQIPLFYNAKLFYSDLDNKPYQDYQSRYLDSPNSALYPFGYGLGYSVIRYRHININTKEIQGNEKAKVSIELENLGKFDATEIVQVYVRKHHANFTNPTKTLRKFRKQKVRVGETVRVDFEIDKRDLVSLDQDLDWTTEEGDYTLWISNSSADEQNFVKIKYIR